MTPIKAVHLRDGYVTARDYDGRALPEYFGPFVVVYDAVMRDADADTEFWQWESHGVGQRAPRLVKRETWGQQ